MVQYTFDTWTLDSSTVPTNSDQHDSVCGHFISMDMELNAINKGGKL